MQVVIDIPDQIYEMVMNTGTYGCYRFNSTKVIREGIPLPKGHGRLGDLNELFEKVGNIKPTSKVHYESIGEFMGLITNTPTIIPAADVPASYQQVTSKLPASYGTETIRCNNEDCPNWKKTEDPCEEHIRKALRAALRRMENEEL